MTINREIGIILLCSLLPNSILGQSICSSILEEKIEAICLKNESWKLDSTNNEVILTFKGNFSTNTIHGSKAVTKKELKHPDANSISFNFQISDGWSDSIFFRVNNNNNRSLLVELKLNYISHYDSAGWSPKHSQSIFEKNPMAYLPQFKYKSEYLYSQIVRLPDFRINECGVWIDTSIDFSTFYIVQPETRDTITLIIQDIVGLDTYVKNSIDGIQNY